MKIYTTNKDILGRVAVDYKVTLEPSDYKGVDIGGRLCYYWVRVKSIRQRVCSRSGPRDERPY